MRLNKAFTILGLYTILTLILTYPLITAFTTHVPGSATWAFDEYTFLWNMWWFKHATLNLQTDPLYSNYIFYPLGISLVLYTFQLFNALLSLPLQSFLNLATISNLNLVFSFVLSGYGMYLLLQYLLAGNSQEQGATAIRHPPSAIRQIAAFIGGMAYAFTASRFVYAALGHYNFVSTEWLPFYVLYLIKTAREPALKNAILAGLFATFALLCENTFGVFLGLFTLLYLLFALGGKEVISSSGGEARASPLLALGGRLAILVVTTLLTYLPVLIPILREMLGGGYALEGWGEGIKLSADLFSFITPTALHPLWGTDWVRELRAVVEGTSRFSDVNTVFVGYAVFGLALLAAIRFWRKLVFWVVSAIVFAILCLGPVLHINGRYLFNLDGLEVTFPLPFALLHYIPIVKANRTPNRFSIVLALSLAVLVGYGVYWFLRVIRVKGRGHWITAALLMALVSFEHLSVPLPLTDARVPEIYRQIGAEPGEFAIMQLPLGWRNSFGTLGAESTQAQYYQSVHHKPIIGGNISRNPPFKFEYFERIPLFKSITDVELYRDVDETTAERARAQAPELMYLYDVRYLVVLPPIPGRLPYADTMTRTLEYVKGVLPLQAEPFYQRQGVLAYRVIQPPPRGEFNIDFGAEGSQIYRGEGWSGDEADLFGATACWATAQGARFFAPLHQMSPYTMTIRAAPFTYPGSPRQALRLRVNGQEVSPPLVMDPGWASYQVSLPLSALRYGLNEISLGFSYLATPRDVLPVDLTIGGTGVKSPADIEVHSATDWADITVGQEDASAHRRGYNIAVLDPQSGQVLDKKGFDTWANEYESQALANFLAGVPPGRIVAVATQGDAARHLTNEAVAALRSIGAKADPRDTPGHSQAIIGVKGAPPGTALEESREGSSYLRVGRNPDRRTLAIAVDYIRFTPSD